MDSQNVPCIAKDSYWAERLANADRRGRLHTAVFDVPEDQWETMNEMHRSCLAATLSPTDNILDFGCGYGAVLDLLPNSWRGKYVGVDLSQALLKRARELHPNRHHTFVRADVRSTLPVQGVQFTVCIGRLLKQPFLEHDEAGWKEVLFSMKQTAPLVVLLNSGDTEVLR